MTIAQTFPLNRTFRITTAVHGWVGVLGNALDAGAPGVVNVQIAPSPDFEGSFQVVGRSRVSPPPGWTAAETPEAPFVQIPYRRLYVGNVVAEYALSSETLTGNCVI